MTAAEAVRWAETRACKDCRHGEVQHEACKKAFEVAELIHDLAESATQGA